MFLGSTTKPELPLRSFEVTNMLTGYANYVPQIATYNYQFIFEDGISSTAGTSATMTPPGGILPAQTGTAASNRTEWVYSFGQGITAPATPPTGTYTIEVAGKGTYTFKNVKPSQISYVGAQNDIVYPALKLVTNESTGLITRVYYKWKIIKNGTARDATTAELETVADTQVNPPKGFSHGSPFLGFSFNDNTGTTPIQFYRDSSYIDIDTVTLDNAAATSRKVLLSDVQTITITYNLTSRTVHRFWFSN